MAALFDYFAEHASYESFDMAKFLELQGCLTKYASVYEFKKFVGGIKGTKGITARHKEAKSFAYLITNDNFSVSGISLTMYLRLTSCHFFIRFWSRLHLLTTGYVKSKLRQEQS
jgi:hypothetical protein